MRTLMVALGFVMLAALSTVHVDTSRATDNGDRVPVAAVPMPSSVPSGVEVLLLVR